MPLLPEVLVCAAAAAVLVLGLLVRRELAGQAFLTLTGLLVLGGLVNWFSGCDGEPFKEGLRNCYPDDSFKGFYQGVWVVGGLVFALWALGGLPLLALAWTSRLNRHRRRLVNYLPVAAVAALAAGVLLHAQWPAADIAPCPVQDGCS